MSPNKLTKQCVCICVCGAAFIFPAASWADACSSKLAPAEQIACLQTENAVLRARIEAKDLRKKLDDGAVVNRNLDLPKVLSIFGSGGSVKAVLAYTGADGGSITASVGNELPNGWIVDSIGDGRVAIRKGESRHILLIGSASTQDPAVRSSLPLLPPRAVFDGGSAPVGRVIPPPPMPYSSNGSQN